VTAVSVDEPTDIELLRAHAAGDSDAFGLLVARHRDRLWAVSLRTLGDREEAADALQDALISAFRAAGRFRGDAAVTTWLHRIVVNACLDRVRRRQSRPTVELPDVEQAGADIDTDTALDVHAALARLPGDQRAAIVLVDMQGYFRRRRLDRAWRPDRYREEQMRTWPGPTRRIARLSAEPGHR